MNDHERDFESDDDDTQEEDSEIEDGRHERLSNMSSEEKRAHHNASERRRRDQLKDSFSNLQDAILQRRSEKSLSRAQILTKSADYIKQMKIQNHAHEVDIHNMRMRNYRLQQQVKALEKAKQTGLIDMDAFNACKPDIAPNQRRSADTESSDEDSTPRKKVHNTKRFKVDSSNHSFS